MQALLLVLALSGISDRESLRFSYSSEQGFDTSCGLTTLACFLDTYWDVQTSESALIEKYFYDDLVNQDFAVSFADMGKILEAEGFSYKAYQMSYEQLRTALLKYAPIIVHYDRPVGHFAIALSMYDGAIITADPAEGTILRERAYFESRWSGKVLVAVKPGGKLDMEALGKAIASTAGRRKLLERPALASAGAGRW